MRGVENGMGRKKDSASSDQIISNRLWRLGIGTEKQNGRVDPGPESLLHVRLRLRQRRKRNLMSSASAAPVFLLLRLGIEGTARERARGGPDLG